MVAARPSWRLSAGDGDGLSCVPVDVAGSVPAAAAEHAAATRELETTASGTHDRARVDATLTAKGYEVEEGYEVKE